MSLLSSCVMGVHGLVYCGAGACMLFPSIIPADWVREASSVHAMLFKPLLRDDDSEEDAETIVSPPKRRDELLLLSDLGYRMLAYVLVLLGVCRAMAAFHWGCGYVYLGLVTCVGEIALVCNELLRYESMHVHRAVAVLLENMVVSIMYISAAVPYCR